MLYIANLNLAQLLVEVMILYIGEDFSNKGYSKGLGHSYDISNYKIADKSTHSFGGTTPQLQECKVYKVLFN